MNIYVCVSVCVPPSSSPILYIANKQDEVGEYDNDDDEEGFDPTTVVRCRCCCCCCCCFSVSHKYPLVNNLFRSVGPSYLYIYDNEEILETSVSQRQCLL